MKALEKIFTSKRTMAEMQEAAECAAKGIRDPQLLKHARRSMDRIREKIRKEQGILDIGVPAIRELRDR